MGDCVVVEWMLAPWRCAWVEWPLRGGAAAYGRGRIAILLIFAQKSAKTLKPARLPGTSFWRTGVCYSGTIPNGRLANERLGCRLLVAIAKRAFGEQAFG